MNDQERKALNEMLAARTLTEGAARELLQDVNLGRLGLDTACHELQQMNKAEAEREEKVRA